jgi:hypothetical protein
MREVNEKEKLGKGKVSSNGPREEEGRSGGDSRRDKENC